MATLVGHEKLKFAAVVVALSLKEEFTSVDCTLLCSVLNIPREEVFSGMTASMEAERSRDWAEVELGEGAPWLK